MRSAARRFQRMGRGGELGMTDAPRAVGLDGGLERLDQRPFRAERHRHVAAAGQLQDGAGVVRDLRAGRSRRHR